MKPHVYVGKVSIAEHMALTGEQARVREKSGPVQTSAYFTGVGGLGQNIFT